MKTKQKKSLAILLSLVAVFLLIFSSVQAQSMGQMSDKSDEEKAQTLTDMQKEKLAFYGTQEQDMYDVNLKYIREMQKIMAGGRSFTTMRKMQDMSGRKDKEVKVILDKDQYKQYKKMKEAMREQMRNSIQGQGNF